MHEISLDYYYERVALRYSIKSIPVVIKVLVRCKKMYEAIENIIKIFKLMIKLEVRAHNLLF